jgi:Xaa-Pro dipeptidase
LHAINRATTALRLIEALSDEAQGVILLKGGDQTSRYDTDHEPLFRQESYFQYLFGVSEEGCFGAVSLKDGAATLFIPRRTGLDYEVFCGRFPSAAEFKEKYGVEDVYFVEELGSWLEAQGCAAAGRRESVYLLEGLNTDSGASAVAPAFASAERFRVDKRALFPAIAESRVFKSAAEVEVMRYANWVSSAAHCEVMRSAKLGMMEYQLESLFLHLAYTHGGCRYMVRRNGMRLGVARNEGGDESVGQ